MDSMEWRNVSIYGNRLGEWLLMLGIVFAALALVALLRFGLRRKFSHAPNTESDIDDFLLDLVGRTKLLLLFVPILAFAIGVVELDRKAVVVVRVAAILAGLVQAGLWLSGFVDYWLGRQRRLRMQADPAAVTTMTAFGFILKLFLWSLVLLLGLDNLGIDVTALIAGLGIGGIAIALATQNILGDLFASLSIVIDKPFVLGDVIHVGEFIGMVEHIGLKTTRVRSLSGEQVIFSNTDLIQSRVRNYKRMRERRVVFRFGLVYHTPAEKLERIPEITRKIIERQPLTRFDRAHFRSFGDSALDFEAVYYVLDPDFNVHMDIQQAVNLGLVRSFQAENIEFAYPTRTVFLQGRQSGSS
jgi:small-conductance mechanosensitive channel